MSISKSIICVTLLIFLSNFINAQCDYINTNYDVRSEMNVIYGDGDLFDGRNIELKMNIFKPVGDDNIKRPIFIWVHGGGFSGGDKGDLNSFCQAMASKGIVTATISYRLGFVRPFSFDYPITYDKHEIIRAVYRGLQDTKSAIRFMKSRNILDSTDIQQVFVGGLSAGGYIALASTYMNEEQDKPNSTGEINAINQGGATIKRPDLGSILGYQNIGEFDATVKGVVNLYGGLMELNYIDAHENNYAYLYHQTKDPVVPCGYNQPYWAFPIFPDRYPFSYGTCEIIKRYDELGFGSDKITSIIHEGDQHTIHDLGLFTETLGQFLNKAICDTTITSDLDISLEKNNIYPNPSIDFIHIPIMKNIFISGLNGNTYEVKAINLGNELKIDISHLNPGIYFISGQQSDNKILQSKFVKL